MRKVKEYNLALENILYNGKDNGVDLKPYTDTLYELVKHITPMKVNVTLPRNSHGNLLADCPKCGTTINDKIYANFSTMRATEMKHCYGCGQRLEFPKEEK